MTFVKTSLVHPQVALSPLSRPVTLAVIVGNRGFFPHHLAAKGRETILGSLEQLGIHAVVPDAGSTTMAPSSHWWKPGCVPRCSNSTGTR